jgi:hypothetical protein
MRACHEFIIITAAAASAEMKGPASAACRGAGGAVIAAGVDMAGSTGDAATPDPPDPPPVATFA